MLNRLKIFLILISIYTGLTSFNQPVRAAENDNYRQQRDNDYHPRWGNDDRREDIAFSAEDQKTIQQYYNNFYQRNCQRNRDIRIKDCLPPGLYKKYTVGKPLAENVAATYLPDRLQQQLSPPPRNYAYLKVDQDILLVSEKTGKVIDAIEVGHTTRFLLPVVNSYVVYFNSKNSGLRKEEGRVLDKAAREIRNYDPRQVTVTSYADSVTTPNSGRQLTDERSEALFLALQAFGLNLQDQDQISPRNTGLTRDLENIARFQEETVSKALLKRNIPNQIVDSKIRGPLENDLESQDDSGIEETRMVVIDFRR